MTSLRLLKSTSGLRRNDDQENPRQNDHPKMKRPHHCGPTSP